MQASDFLNQATLLRDCQLFVFDLDGTMYEETAHFAYYGEQLAKFLPESKVTAYFRDVQRSLAGEHAVSYGSTYDVVNQLVYRDSQIITPDGETVTDRPPSSQVVHVDDPWGVYGALAIFYGVHPDDIQTAFLATRDYMKSDAFAMRGMPGLREAVDKLRTIGRHFVLATNSPEGDSSVIMQKLGLFGALEDEIFSAKKPTRIVQQFTGWSERFGVPFAQMVSIGDHFRNEIVPAHELGMKTVYIDRYIGRSRPEATVQIEHPTQIAVVLNQVIESLETLEA